MRKKRLSHTTIAGICIAVLLLTISGTACDLPWQDSSDETVPTDTPEVAATDTPETVLDEATEAETVDEEESSDLTGKSCLQGTWELDQEAAQAYLSMTMIGNDELSFTPSGVSGDNSLLITSDEMRAIASNLQADMITNGDTISVVVNGTVYGDYTATAKKIELTDIVYSLSGNLVEPVRTSEMNLDTLFAFAQSLSFGKFYDSPPTKLEFSYSCAGNLLSIKLNQYASISMTRTQN